MSETGERVKEIFEEMPNRLNAAAASGVDCVIQHDLSGDGGGSYYVAIKDGACTVTEGSHEAPSMTLMMEAADFVGLTKGELDGMAAFMGGKLKVAGDPMLATKLQQILWILAVQSNGHHTPITATMAPPLALSDGDINSRQFR